MSYAALLKELAAAPQGVCVLSVDQAAREAQEAGLVEVFPAWDVDRIVLTDAGRRMVGLPIREKARSTGWLEAIRRALLGR